MAFLLSTLCFLVSGCFIDHVGGFSPTSLNLSPLSSSGSMGAPSLISLFYEIFFFYRHYQQRLKVAKMFQSRWNSPNRVGTLDREHVIT